MVEAMGVCQVVSHSTGTEALSVSFVRFYFLKGLLMDDVSFIFKVKRIKSLVRKEI